MQTSDGQATFPTHNLRALVRDVVLRLAGKNDKAVRQLELTYGGGKTHTLITLRHLAHDPAALPDLPAVAEFEQAIGMKPPKARVAGLCFDKLDVETGMDVRSPGGNVRRLKQPWSVLAYQIAGDDGLKLLHADKKAEERESAPAENVLTELLELPVKQGMGVLILIDEVLMYVREKVALTPEYRARMVNFFQYLTQAATKVDRCCIVASLLASDPKNDAFGNELKSELYDIFQRQREEAVEPVVKEDVAEVLRRRFFTTESIKTPGDFKQHVIAAIKGIADLDEQTAKQGVATEERYLKSFPFHPELTEVFYSKWTQLDGFQRTRGVLRTFALALREAEKWDTSPLVGPAAFLGAPGKAGLSEAVVGLYQASRRRCLDFTTTNCTLAGGVRPGLQRSPGHGHCGSHSDRSTRDARFPRAADARLPGLPDVSARRAPRWFKCSWRRLRSSRHTRNRILDGRQRRRD